MTWFLAGLAVAGLAAIVAWLRLWYYARRMGAIKRREAALWAELHGLRSERGRLFWEGAQ